MEVVGDYDRAPWPIPVADLVYGTAAALLNWRDLGPALNGHRECLPNKTCPGSAINLDIVRAELARRMSSPTVPGKYRVTAEPSLRIRVGPGPQYTQVGSVVYSATVQGVLVVGTAPDSAGTNQWLQIGNQRFVWAGYVESVQ